MICANYTPNSTQLMNPPAIHLDLFRNQILASSAATNFGTLEGIKFDRGVAISTSWRDRLKTSLSEVYEKNSVANWDGYNASPINTESFEFALKFVEMLPEGIEVPDIVPESDGELAFEWRVQGKPKILSISVGKNTLVYAGIFSQRQREQGEEVFFDSIPENLSRLLSSHFRKAG